MDELKIKCPSCGKIIGIANKPGIENASFTCPVCKERHKVGECPKVIMKPISKDDSEKTQYGIDQHTSSDTEKTRYSASDFRSNDTHTKSELKIGVLVDNFGNVYQLYNGINSIGRKASSSPASVQIAVEDRYMSRNHAIIEVRNSGGNILHIMKNGANKNPSYVNGKLIESFDQVILNHGDKIKLGYTELTFKL